LTFNIIGYLRLVEIIDYVLNGFGAGGGAFTEKLLPLSILEKIEMIDLNNYLKGKR